MKEKSRDRDRRIMANWASSVQPFRCDAASWYLCLGIFVEGVVQARRLEKFMGFMDKDIKCRWLLLSSLAESEVFCLSELLLYDMGL